MKRQKRILASAAAMLLALGMIISCDTPANSGSSDGGSAGGSIIFPEGNPEAESKLVGTWVKDNLQTTLELNENGTYKQIGESIDKGTWSATDTVLYKMYEEPTPNSISFDFDEDSDTLSLNMGSEPLDLFRDGSSSNSAEGTWKNTSITLRITPSSFEIISQISPDLKFVVTGIRNNTVLTPETLTGIRTIPYTLSEDGNTLILNPDTEFSSTYTKQQ